jgi:hypothetical protein
MEHRALAISLNRALAVPGLAALATLAVPLLAAPINPCFVARGKLPDYGVEIGLPFRLAHFT